MQNASCCSSTNFPRQTRSHSAVSEHGIRLPAQVTIKQSMVSFACELTTSAKVVGVCSQAKHTASLRSTTNHFNI